MTRRHRVLLVDDMDEVRLAVLEQLESLGCEVTTAADGLGALAVLGNGATFDLVLTDLGLPGGMNGLRLAEAVSVLRPGLKVPTMSGYNSPEFAIPGKLRPEWKTLRKPFRREVLANAMRKLFDAS